MIHPSDVERKPFHLEKVEVGPESALLHIIWCPEHPNEAERAAVEYPFPKHFPGDSQGEYIQVVEALAEHCPLHMIGFEEYHGALCLANAQSVWGYVCPCQFVQFI